MKSFKSLAFPTVVVLAMAAATTGARAESPTLEDQASIAFAHTMTRAQVQAELAQARVDGSMKVWSTSYNHMAAFKSERSRDAVAAEAVAANLSGADATWFGEDSGSFELARLTQPVRGTFVAAR